MPVSTVSSAYPPHQGPRPHPPGKILILEDELYTFTYDFIKGPPGSWPSRYPSSSPQQPSSSWGPSTPMNGPQRPGYPYPSAQSNQGLWGPGSMMGKPGPSRPPYKPPGMRDPYQRPVSP